MSPPRDDAAMNLNDPVRWAVIDMLRSLDRFHDAGELHAEFVRIAGTLGIELPAVVPPSDPALDSEDEIDREAQASEQDRVLKFLGSQTEPATLGRIVAELNANRWTVNSTLHRLLKKGQRRTCWPRCLENRGAG
jgi:hypothetical protein